MNADSIVGRCEVLELETLSIHQRTLLVNHALAKFTVCSFFNIRAARNRASVKYNAI